MLPPEAIREFQHLYKKTYGLSLSYEEAADRSMRLVNLYKAVIGNNNLKETNLETYERDAESRD